MVLDKSSNFSETRRDRTEVTIVDQ